MRKILPMNISERSQENTAKSSKRESIDEWSDRITAMMIENLNRKGKAYPAVKVPDVPPLSGEAERSRLQAERSRFQAE